MNERKRRTASLVSLCSATAFSHVDILNIRRQFVRGFGRTGSLRCESNSKDNSKSVCAVHANWMIARTKLYEYVGDRCAVAELRWNPNCRDFFHASFSSRMEVIAFAIRLAYRECSQPVPVFRILVAIVVARARFRLLHPAIPVKGRNAAKEGFFTIRTAAGFCHPAVTRNESLERGRVETGRRLLQLAFRNRSERADRAGRWHLASPLVVKPNPSMTVAHLA